MVFKPRQPFLCIIDFRDVGIGVFPEGKDSLGLGFSYI
jgi:hypothetical protein